MNKKDNCKPLIIPKIFNQCLTYWQMCAYLEKYKQQKLIPGNNITLVDNKDGTFTISATGSAGGGDEYTIVSVTADAGFDTAYQLKNVSTGEVVGAKIQIPAPTDISELQTQVDGISTLLDETAATAHANTDSISNINDNIEQINTKLTNHTEHLTTIDGEIGTLSGQMRDNETGIENLKTDVNNNTAAITSLTSSVTANTEDINTIKSEVETLQTDSGDNTTAIDNLKTSKQNKLVQGANVTLTDNEDGTTTISAVGGGTAGYEYTMESVTPTDDYEAAYQLKNITTGQASGDTINIPKPTDITALTQQVETVENNIEQANERITDIQNELQNNYQNKLVQGSNVTLTDNEDGTTTISAAGFDDTEIKNEIAALQDTVDSNTDSITTLDVKMSTAETNITSLQSGLDAANSSISTAQTNITTLQSDIETANTNISGLETSKQNKLTAGSGISITDNSISNKFSYYASQAGSQYINRKLQIRSGAKQYNIDLPYESTTSVYYYLSTTKINIISQMQTTFTFPDTLTAGYYQIFFTAVLESSGATYQINIPAIVGKTVPILFIDSNSNQYWGLLMTTFTKPTSGTTNTYYSSLFLNSELPAGTYTITFGA